MNRRAWLWGGALAYAVLALGTWVALHYSRSYVLQTFATEEARAEWQTWRDEAARQSGPAGPVRRRVPAIDEPPALVLLRDHFAGVALGVYVFVSLTFAFVALIIRGMVTQGSVPTGLSPQDA